jgi:hypothetical protein
MPGLDPLLSGLAASRIMCVPKYSIVILGLVPRIHDFLAGTQSRGWSACADHDGIASVKPDHGKLRMTADN